MGVFRAAFEAMKRDQQQVLDRLGRRAVHEAREQEAATTEIAQRAIAEVVHRAALGGRGAAAGVEVGERLGKGGAGADLADDRGGKKQRLGEAFLGKGVGVVVSGALGRSGLHRDLVAGPDR